MVRPAGRQRAGAGFACDFARHSLAYAAACGRGEAVDLALDAGRLLPPIDHERHNYLWLAHSKLRQAALGPELLIGPPPQHVEGSSRIRRGDALLWERPFLSGEANMSHSLANLEAHHFKYAQFRRPGDVHVHFFGTATLSFTDGVRTEPGDVFEIEAAPFMLPLRNPLSREADMPVLVRAL